MIAHEGQHGLNAGLFSGKNAWKDEVSAVYTQLNVGRTLGILKYEQENLVEWANKPRDVLQAHMVNGMVE